MSELEQLAEVIRRRNELAVEITKIINRPAQIGHLGEFIASKIFDITLEESATAKAIDGYFNSGPLAGRSVNVKWYAKAESLLDITPSQLPDVYLVMTGPRSSLMTSRGEARPWWIDYVYLFDANELASRLDERGVKVGIATSVRRNEWEQGEIHPRDGCPLLQLSDQQHKLLKLFSSDEYQVPECE